MSEQPTRIFIVEDDPMIAMEITHRLTRRGYAVCGVAARGEEAIRRIADAKPDLVLMDVNLTGELNGIETARRLGEQGDVAVVFVSAYSDDKLLQRAADTGPFGYIVKPFGERELHATLQMALYKHRAERALREANARLDERVRERTAQLAASEQRFTDFARIGADWLWETDPADRFVYSSPSSSRPGLDHKYRLGRTRREVALQNPENLARIAELEEMIARREPFQDFLYQVLRTDGELIWCRISGEPTFDASGTVLGYRGGGRDVTELVETQNALHAKTRILDAMLAAMPDGVRIIDANRRDVASNDQLYEILAIDKEAARASPDPVHFALIEMARRGEYGPGEPETLARARIASLWSEVTEKGSLRYERQFKHGRWIELRIQAIEGGGLLTLYRDMTEAKSRERELARQSDLLRTIFANMGAGITVFDSDLRLVAWNEGAPAMVGIDPSWMRKGVPARDLLVAQARNGEFGPCDPEAEADRRIAEMWPDKTFLMEQTRPDGRSYELRRRPMAGGGFVTIYVDTIQRRAAERALRDLNETLERRVEERTAALTASERFNRATLDALAAHIVVLDPDGAIVATNAAWLRFAGGNDIDGQNVSEGANYLEICDRAAGACSEEAHPVAAGIREAIAGRRDHFEIEYHCHLPDGERWFLCRVSRFQYDGPLRLVVSHEDVTAVHDALRLLADSEQAFAVLAEVSPVGIFRTDAEGRRLAENRRWREIAGFSEEQARGDGWASAVHVEDRARVFEEWTAAARSGTDFRSEYRYQRPDGDVVWLIGQARPIKSPQGAVTGFIGAVTDITERKQTELALRAISAELAVMQGPAYLEAAARVLREILGAEVAFVSKARAAMPVQLHTVAMIEDGHLMIGDRQVLPNLAYAVVEPLIDSSGPPLGHIGVMSSNPLASTAQTVSILKLFGVAVAAEVVRQRSERRFADLVELAPDAIVTIDSQGRISMANQAAEQMFGWTREELAGQHVEILMPPALRPGHPRLRDDYLRSGGRRMMGLERPTLHARRKDGSEFPVEISIAPIEADDGKSVVAIVRDVTAREAAEREVTAVRGNLLDAIESIEQSILLLDDEDRVVLFNNRFVENYREIADAIKVGIRFEDLFRASIEHGLVIVPAGQRTDEFIAERVARHRRADGTMMTQRFANGRVFRVSEHRARNGGIIVVSIDVTEQLKTEQQLREAQKMEAIGKLTGGLAHDFNNYLGIIIGNLDLLGEREATDPAAMQLIDAALKAALRGAELTRSLLAFSRRQPLDPELFDLSHRVDMVANLLKRTLGEDIRLTTQLPPGLWPVRIDGAQLDSCIVNLANNARDAMPRGGALVISTRNVYLDELYARTNAGAVSGDYVLIEVSDTGTGMPPDILAHVFEPFFTTKGLGRGTGLGLSMVYGFVKQSGGYIKIYSEVGHGTAIRIYLPRAGEVGAAVSVASDAPARDSLPEGTETILVVEDNEQMLQTAAAQLRSLGYEVIEAANGAAALTILDQRERHLDLLFTDIVMPEKPDGSELARLALKRRPEIKVLLTSGFPGDQLKYNGKHKGKLGLLGKPYRKDELARAIRTALASKPPSPDGPE